jgi:hypothetical protein
MEDTKRPTHIILTCQGGGLDKRYALCIEATALLAVERTLAGKGISVLRRRELDIAND